MNHLLHGDGDNHPNNKKAQHQHQEHDDESKEAENDTNLKTDLEKATTNDMETQTICSIEPGDIYVPKDEEPPDKVDPEHGGFDGIRNDDRKHSELDEAVTNTIHINVNNERELEDFNDETKNREQDAREKFTKPITLNLTPVFINTDPFAITMPSPSISINNINNNNNMVQIIVNKNNTMRAQQMIYIQSMKTKWKWK